MLHPLFSTLIQRPDLLVEHVSAYSALFHQEATQAGSQLVKRYMAWAVAAICGLAFVLFTGIALMMGALHNQFHWVLLAVPGATLLLMLAAIAKAKAPLTEARFTELKAQIDSDIQALKAAS
jgi:type IV secretory pathway VirB2 component (pilin)